VSESGVSNVFGVALFSAFGLWWLLAPESELHLYRRLHGEKLRLPSPVVIRVLGGAWMLALVTVWFVKR
jgi:hypothetical protein